MISVYNSSGTLIYSVPETEGCTLVQQLTRADYIQLDWNEVTGDTIPAGAYIEYEGEHYTLIEPYIPTQENERKWHYQPQFQSLFFTNAKTPFFFYTFEAGSTHTAEHVISKEPDWSLTSAQAFMFLDRIQESLLIESGQKYEYAIDANLPVVTATLQFNSVDIISACNAIANAFETELWLEKYAEPDGEGNIGCLHLSKAQYGTRANLSTDRKNLLGTVTRGNVRVPNITRNGEYYNRFYCFGSSRNIVQDYQGASVNNLVTKRLTLDPTLHPDGYIDLSQGGPVFSKILQFEDIYPAATELVVYDVTYRERYRLDKETSKPIILGYDDDTPIYDIYYEWYMRIGTKSGSTYTPFVFDDSYYAQDNPDGMRIAGLTPSFHFSSGALLGREFELDFLDLDDDTDFPKDERDAGANPFHLDAGQWWMIHFIEDGNYIVPSISGVIPDDDDHVILFNIRMPDAYVQDAYDRLEEAALDEIDKNYIKIIRPVGGGDPIPQGAVSHNSYRLESNPVAFEESDPGLFVGRSVRFRSSTVDITTRVTALTKRLARPYYQTIELGDELIRGAIEELREDAVEANTQYDLIAALGRANQKIAETYERINQLLLNQIADQAGIWEKYDEGNGVVSVKLNDSYAGAWANGFITAKGPNSNGGLVVHTLGQLEDVTIDDTTLTGGQVLKYDATSHLWVNADESGGGGGGSSVAWNARTQQDLPEVGGYIGLTVNNGTAVKHLLSLYGHSHLVTEIFPGLSGLPGQNQDGKTIVWQWNSAQSSGQWVYGEAGGSLPIASASTLGGIKVGSNLSINSSTGVLSATVPDISGTYLKYFGWTDGNTLNANNITFGSYVFGNNQTNVPLDGNGNVTNGSIISFGKTDDYGPAQIVVNHNGCIFSRILWNNGIWRGWREAVLCDTAQTITGQKTFASHVAPSVPSGTTPAYNLGTNEARWANVYSVNCNTNTLFVAGQASNSGKLVRFGENGQLVTSGLAYDDIVTRSGIQNITGQKTFSAAPLSEGYTDLGNKNKPWGNVFIGGNYSLSIADGNGHSKTIFKSNGYDDDGQGHTATILFGNGTKASHTFRYYALGHVYYVYDANATDNERVVFQFGASENISHQTLRPYTNNTYSLGTSGNAWSHLYLAAGGSIYAGSNARITVSNTARQHVSVSNDLKVVGDIWLKGSGNYGNKIILGDRSSNREYCYIAEADEDVLTLHGDNGVVLSTDDAAITANGHFVPGNLTSGVSSYNLGGASALWNNLYAQKWYPVSGNSNLYVEWNSTKNAFVFHGNVLATGAITAKAAGSGSASFPVDVSGSIVPTANNTYNLGNEGGLFNTVYATHLGTSGKKVTDAYITTVRSTSVYTSNLTATGNIVLNNFTPASGDQTSTLATALGKSTGNNTTNVNIAGLGDLPDEMESGKYYEFTCFGYKMLITGYSGTSGSYNLYMGRYWFKQTATTKWTIYCL